MTERIVAVCAGPECGQGAPPGIDPEEFRLAVVEDTYELVAGLDLVTAAIAAPAADRAAIEELCWPGTPIVEIDAPAGGAVPARAVLAALAALGADQAVVVAGDAPDLPGLLIGKLLRGLGGSPVAVCPAEGGGLVALAGRLPVADWLGDVTVDEADAVDTLRAAAPRSADVHVGPGWHRLRNPADVAALDPGLEGWPATRLLLSPA